MVPVWLGARVETLRLLGCGRAALVLGCLALLAFASGLSVVVGQEPTREYRFEGRANVDGAPAPKGTIVEIRVEGQTIAQSLVTDEQGTWAIQVDANVLKQGVCDATFFVGGKQAERQWNRCTVSIVLEVSKPPVTTPPVVDPKTPIQDPEGPKDPDDPKDPEDPDDPTDDPDDPNDDPDDPNDDPDDPNDDPDDPNDDPDDPNDDPDDPNDDPDDPNDDPDDPNDPNDDPDDPNDDPDDPNDPNDPDGPDGPPGDDPPGDEPTTDDTPNDDSPTGDTPADDPSTDDEADDSTTSTSDESGDDGDDGDDSTTDSSTQRPGAPPRTGSGGLIKDGGPSDRLVIASVVATTLVVVGIAAFALPRRRRS